MRSIAVTLVLIDHTSYVLGYPFIGTWETAWLGIFGVSVFFVHTSLVLMWSLERQPHVLNFYIRRAFRIYPLAMAAIFIALAFNIPVSPLPADTFAHHHFDFKTILANLLLIQNFHGPDVEGVMWTLSIEVQMYVGLPVLFFYADKLRRLWPLITLWLLAAATTSFLTHTKGNTLLTVIPDFLPGVMAFVAFGKLRPRLPSWTFVPFLVALLAIFERAPGPRAVWPLMLTLGLALPLFRQITNRFTVRASHLVAKYSYGIYLAHPFGIVLGFKVLARQSATVRVGSELLFTAAAAILAYHLLEEPMIRIGSRIAHANDVREARQMISG